MIPVPWWLYLILLAVFVAGCELVRWWQRRPRRQVAPFVGRYVRKPRLSELRGHR